tara:strand:+ start:25882 stop:26157 length:276 start_codon:yes stop_codon:yes gene_type:complete
MNKSIIEIEYDESYNTEKKRVVDPKNSKRWHYKDIKVDDPKAWEIITVENNVTLVPGYRLNKKQVEVLCKNTRYDVRIGMPGQFRVSNSRY